MSRSALLLVSFLVLTACGGGGGGGDPPVVLVTTLADMSAITVPITTTQQYLCRQFVTDICRPALLQGTFSMVLRGLENATTNNVFLAYVLRAVTPDGGTFLGTLSSST